MSRKRPAIVYLHPWHFTMGGAQRFVSLLAEYFSEFCDVHIIYPHSRQEDIWSKAVGKNVTVHGLKDLARTEELLAKIDPDIVHHHMPSGNWAMKYVRKNFKIIGTQHRWDHNKRVPSFVVPICKNGSDPSRVINHGVDLEKFTPLKKRKQSDKFVIGFVGRRSMEKLPKSFIDALEKWEPPSNVVFRFIGHGILAPYTKELADKLSLLPFVELTGDIDPENMPDEYRKMDVLIIPSENDSVSFAALEAMACGVPIIARAVEGLPDTIGDAGILIDVNTKSDADKVFFDEIESLMKNKKRLASLRKIARKRVVKNYSLKEMVSKYAAIYEQRTCGIIRRSEGFDVSVVMPVWNTAPRWLRESVESVLSQRGVRFELVLIDDGSDRPDTISELGKIAKDHPSAVVLIRRNHSGTGAALNVGVRAARADLIARHDSDDVMPEGRLEKQFAIMTKDGAPDILSGQMQIIDGEENTNQVTNLSMDTNKAVWQQPWCIAHPTVMFRRYCVLKVGGYAERGPAQDFDLWCRLQRNESTFKVLGGTLAQNRANVFVLHRRHGGQVTACAPHIERAQEIKAWHEWQAKNLAPSPMGAVSWTKRVIDGIKAKKEKEEQERKSSEKTIGVVGTSKRRRPTGKGRPRWGKL